MNGNLYKRDYYSWATGQARMLRDRKDSELDWENLAEEVEDLANRNADALECQSERLIGHLLKIAVAPSRIRNENLRLWQLSVRDARRKVRTILKRNPGLQNRTKELFIDRLARRTRSRLGRPRDARRSYPGTMPVDLRTGYGR